MPLVGAAGDQGGKSDRDFVIAVDTSMSTSGALVRQFLACTYAILRSTATFTRKVNIRIIQCDDRVRSDTVIHDLEDLRSYMDDFTLNGGSATDFRPVFEYVDRLRREGAFTSLRDWCTLPTAWASIRPSGRPMTWPSCCWRSRRFP